MKRRFFICVFLVAGFILTSCKTFYQPQSVDFEDYRITATLPPDSMVRRLVQPYSDSVNKSMNDVIAQVESSLDKKQPEGSLNNVVADALIHMAEKKFQTKVDAAFVNYGGMRLTQIPSGPLTKGKVYELSPFDNLIVLLSIKGNQLQEFLNLVAGRGGWPVAGVRMEIRDKVATSVFIQGNLLDTAKTYTIATLDYVANGGDNASMLSALPRQDVGYLFRDALLEYFSAQTKEG
ncbi:MAG TPA: 5'-nucleotidase C-terminal domain-containing protein, partial [Flavitalea sp.]|nr:5'-nucleotidase C-terminal domain-containing protein [Flavitalea sp.]